jgi:hypothetical protein
LSVGLSPISSSKKKNNLFLRLGWVSPFVFGGGLIIHLKKKMADMYWAIISLFLLLGGVKEKIRSFKTNSLYITFIDLVFLKGSFGSPFFLHFPFGSTLFSSSFSPFLFPFFFYGGFFSLFSFLSFSIHFLFFFFSSVFFSFLSVVVPSAISFLL